MSLFSSNHSDRNSTIRHLLIAGAIAVTTFSFSLNFIWDVVQNLVTSKTSNELILPFISIVMTILGISWIVFIMIRKNQQIQHERHSFFSILDNSPFAIYLHDLDGNVLFFNRTGCSMFGYAPDEMKNKPLSEFAKTIDIEKEKVRWEALKENQQVTLEGINLSKSLLVLDVEATVTKINFLGQTVILAFIKDITAKKIAERALAEKTNRLELALDGTNAGMWDMDLSSGKIVVDDRWARIIGYELDEILPLDETKLKEMAHPDDLKTPNRLLSEHIAANTDQFASRIRIRHKLGHWVTTWVKGKITEFDESGKAIRAVGTHVDISNLAESQRALEESEAMFRALVDSLDETILVIDRSLVCREAYGKLIKQGVLDKEIFIGKAPSHSVGPENGELMEQYMQKALQGQEAKVDWSPEPNNYKQTNFSLITNNQNETLGLVSLTRDVTKEKNSELKLMKEKDRMAFLARSGSELNKISSKEDTYEYIAQSLNGLMESTGVVLAIDYTEHSDMYKIMSLAGNPLVLEELNKINQAPLKGSSKHKDKELYEVLKNGKILDLTQRILNRNEYFSESMQERLHLILRDFKIKTLGITHNDIILGNVTFLCNKELMTMDEELIYAFINQASAALEKNIALHKLSESQKELQENQEKYKTLVDTAPAIIYEHHLDEGAKYYSKQVSNILGYSSEHLLSDALWKKSIHEEDRDIVRKAEQDFMSGNSFDVEYRIMNQNGEWRWFRDLSMNHGTDSKLIRGMVVDITQEKHLSNLILSQLNQLKEQEVVLRMAIESAQQGVFDWNLTSDHMTWNTEFLKILKNDANLDLTFYEYFYGYVHKDDRMIMAPKLEKIFAGEVDSMDEVFRINTENGIKWIKATGSLVEKTPEGTGLRVIGTMMNITDMKEAEQAQEEHSRQMKLIMESIPGIVFSCHADEGYSMEFISDYVKIITGYEATDFYTKTLTFNDLIHLDDRENVRNAIGEAYVEKRRYAVSYRIVSKSGKERWLNEVGEFRSYKSPIEINKIDGVIFDITDNIKSEERMLNATIDATDRERMRIALEIHNNIQQTLVNAYLSFESMKPEMLKFSEKQQVRFLNGLKSLNTGLEDTRLIARTLMPKQVQDFGYVDSVENLIANLDPFIQFDFYQNIEERFDEKTELNLFRITQEALDNIVKHSKAKEVHIQLIKHDNTMTLTIEDDGVGFNAKDIETLQGGYGIHAMKSRAANLNARFELSSRPEKGTYMIVEVPMKLSSNPINYV